VKILGVSRGGEYSPNMQDNDAAIFEAVADNLRQRGCEVECFSEHEFASLASLPEVDAVFTMARSSEALIRLEQMESIGVLVVNSSEGIRNAVRLPMTQRLLEAGIAHPESWIVTSPDDALPTFSSGDAYWIKRADGCAQLREDVCFVRNREELDSAIEAFRKRNITQLVINRHLEGDLVKFYGVEGTGFFHFYYPSASRSKFGLEEINGAPEGFHFSAEELKNEADRAAAVLSIPVYGGDCVVAPDGSYKIIDFNDWPSFSICRAEAAQAISNYIFKGL